MLEAILTALHNEVNRFPSESALARDLQIPQRTLNDILAGRTGIGTRTLARILAARPEWVQLLNHDLDPQPGGGDGRQPVGTVRED